MIGYSINLKDISLNQFQRDLETVYQVPGRRFLHDNLPVNIEKLRKQGISICLKLTSPFL